MSVGCYFLFGHSVEVVRVEIDAIVPGKRPVGIEFDRFEVILIRQFADQTVIYLSVLFNYFFKVHATYFTVIELACHSIVAYLDDVFDVVQHGY